MLVNDFIVPASLVACFQITGCSLRNLSSSGTASAEVFRSSDVPCSLSTSLVALNCMLFKPLIRPVSRRAELKLVLNSSRYQRHNLHHIFQQGNQSPCSDRLKRSQIGIRQVKTFRIDETFEDQSKTYRINVRDPKQISD